MKKNELLKAVIFGLFILVGIQRNWIDNNTQAVIGYSFFLVCYIICVIQMNQIDTLKDQVNDLIQAEQQRKSMHKYNSDNENNSTMPTSRS